MLGKILQIQNNFNIAASDLAEQIAYAIKESGGEVSTSFLSDKNSEQQATSYADEIKRFNFSKKSLKGSRRKIIKHIKCFITQQPEHKSFNYLIAHRFKPINIALSLNKASRFKKVISVVHGFGDYDRKYRQWLIRWLVKDNCYFVAVSEPVRQYLLKLSCGFTEKNTVTINNAIDIERVESIQLSREAARKALGLDDSKRIIGTIGRLVPVKDHKTLIQAAALLKGSFPDMQVAIIGGGRLEAELQELIQNLQVEQQVILLGEQADAAQYAKAFDIFTLTSLSEGLPLALLEGMVARLPVVGSDIPSIKWIIDKVGLTYSVGNAQALADKLEHYLSMEPETLQAEGERFYQYVCRDHNIEDFRAQYLALLNC